MVMAPESIAAWRTSCWPPRRKSALGRCGALDHDVVALGRLGEHGLGLEAAHLDVVEGEVEDARSSISRS
jgi:hypothetical protein